MLNASARILLTCTALAPVGLVYAWVAYFQTGLVPAIWIAALSATLVLLCLLLLARSQHSIPVSEFTANSIETADQENTAFLLLYAMPLFTSQFNTLDWSFWIPTGGIVAVLTSFSYGYDFNPLLGLLGWHFYKVQSTEGVTFVLISKRQLRDCKTTIKVGELTEYVLLDLEA